MEEMDQFGIDWSRAPPGCPRTLRIRGGRRGTSVRTPDYENFASPIRGIMVNKPSGGADMAPYKRVFQLMNHLNHPDVFRFGI